MRLHGELVHPECRPEPDVDDRLVLAAADLEPADVDADRETQRALGPDVRGREPEGPAPPRPAYDLTADRVGTTQKPRRCRQIAALERRADLRGRDRDSVDHERRHDVRVKS